jgi:hypothetical protein
MAEQDVHQRGLARAILAEERENFAAPELQRNIVIGGQRTKALGYVAEFEHGGRHEAGLKSGSRVRGNLSEPMDAPVLKQVPDTGAKRDYFGSSALSFSVNAPDLISLRRASASLRLPPVRRP